MSASRAKIFGRGTITLRTGVSVNSKTLWMISISVWSRTPCWRPSLTRCLISSSETKVRGPASRMPKSAQHEPRGGGQELDRPSARRGPCSRNGAEHEQGDRLRVAQGQRLRHELAEDELDVDDGEAHERARHERRAARSARSAAAGEDRLEVARGQEAAQDAGQGAADGDADLDRGQELVHVVLEAPCTRARGAAALLDEAARCGSRRAEMIAISLPEKKPFPSSSRKIEAAMKRGSDMALERPCLPEAKRPPRARLAPARGL